MACGLGVPVWDVAAVAPIKSIAVDVTHVNVKLNVSHFLQSIRDLADLQYL